jgi:hypothetical protein
MRGVGGPQLSQRQASSPGKKITTRFLVPTKTKEPVVEEHVREVSPAAVKCTLAGVERAWRAIESGVSIRPPAPCPARHAAIGRRVGRGLADGLGGKRHGETCAAFF